MQHYLLMAAVGGSPPDLGPPVDAVGVPVQLLRERGPYPGAQVIPCDP